MKDKKLENKLRKLCEKYQVEWDLYDFKAKEDTTLTTEENLAIITEDIMILAGSNNVEEKIKSDFKTKKTNITQEKQEVEKIKMQHLNEELEFTQHEFKKSLEQLQNNNSVLEKLYWLPKKYMEVVTNSNNDIFGLVLTGQAGTSKSYSTIQTLNKLKIDYAYFSGYTTPLGLYEFLYNNRESGKTIVFDDTFGILNNTTSVMLMLNALYASAGKRKISWGSSKLKDLPSEFIFESNVILIINEVPNNIGTELINSRCLNYRFDFNNFEMLSIMKAIANLKHPILTKKERHEIIEFIEKNVDETTKQFDLRTQSKIENLYLFNKEIWKELAMPLVESKNEKLVMLKQFIKSSSTLQEAKSQWCEATGLTERSFQRANKQLKQITTKRQ